MRLTKLLTVLSFLLFLQLSLVAQDERTFTDKILSFPDKTFEVIDKQSEVLQARLQKQLLKYLSKLQKQEARLHRKLAAKDSLGAAKLLEAQQEYSKWKERLQNPASFVPGTGSVYSNKLDSLKTALSFLSKNELVSSGQKLTASLGKLNQLQGRLNQTQQLQEFLESRKQFLQEKLLSLGLKKQLDKFRKEVYYYREQIQEYKDLLEDPEKLTTKALQLLTRTNVFRKFFADHSELAQIFNLPGSTRSEALPDGSIPGLQTRALLQQELAQRFGREFNLQETLQQNMPSGGSGGNPFDEIRNRASEAVGSASRGNKEELALKDFRPNSNRTKTFWKRLQPGGNIQTTKSNLYFPVTSDVALSLGYKLTDRNVFGVATSFKMGWGKNWRNIQITAEGLSLRSYWDWRAKGNWWLTAGAELHYRQRIDELSDFKDYRQWTRSAVAGLSKKYKVGKKWQGSVQLLYDFLYKQQTPPGQQVLMRVGYNLK